MKKIFVFLCCVSSAVSYGQQAPAGQFFGQPQSAPRAVPIRTVSRTALERRSSASAATASAPATPLSSSPSDRQVSFSGLAAHASTSEPSSPRPPVGTAPTPLNTLIRDQDRAALAGERQAAALERVAVALERLVLQNERLVSQGEASSKVLKAMSKSVEALVVAHAALHDDEDNPSGIGMKSLLFLSEQREKIINARSSSSQH